MVSLRCAACPARRRMRRRMIDRQSVLFLCTGNSARSLMAEALLRHEAGDRFEALSAGTDPKGVNPLTVRALQEIGVSATGLRSQPLSEYLSQRRIDCAVIVCDKANEACPATYPFSAHRLYWPFDDPAVAVGDEAQRLAAFREVRDQIHARIKEWLASR